MWWVIIIGITITALIFATIMTVGAATGTGGIAATPFIGPVGGAITGGGMIRLVTAGAIGMTAGGGGRIQIT